jgi:hypothetical protein
MIQDSAWVTIEPVTRPPLPRFHGAWALLGAALVPGLALSTPGADEWALAGSILFAFLGFGCLEPGSVAGGARGSLRAWVWIYAAASLLLFALAARRLPLASLVPPALAGAAIGAVRLRPPSPALGRPMAREVLGMALLGLSLPVLLLSGGVPLPAAAALYLLYLGFFGLRLAFVRALIGGKPKRAVSLRYPTQAAIVAALLWGMAFLLLGLDPRVLLVVLPILVVGLIRLLGDPRAERSVRSVGIEELLSAIAFVVGLIALGSRLPGSR